MPKDTLDQESKDPASRAVILRKPTAEDGSDIWQLVRDCAPLDENSMYCNLIQADHFADTCVVAEKGGRIVGWVSGHMIPGEDTFFVWQVAVSAEARGLGLGRRMLNHLVARPECRTARALKTTITKSNAASWALFRGFARQVGGDLSDAPHFERDRHFDGAAATEHMVTITLPRVQARLRAVA
jgi:L-2,4-diaminobutyric acid acetyltransferase